MSGQLLTEQNTKIPREGSSQGPSNTVIQKAPLTVEKDLAIFIPPEEVSDPDTLHLAVHVIRDPHQTAFREHAVGAYGLVYWGLGRAGKLWGAGFAPQDDPLRAYAILRALEVRDALGAPHIKLEVTVAGLKKILEDARHSNGLKTNGRPFCAFELYKRLNDEIAANRIVLIKPTRADEKSFKYLTAVSLAVKGNRHAEAYSKFMADAFPGETHGIYVTESNPDPYGLLKGLRP